MKSWTGLLGFLSPKDQENVSFRVLKNISYSTRIAMYLMFMILGFIIQIFTMRAWPGAVFLICATVLSFIKGYDARVNLKTFSPDKNWTPVDMERINEIKNLKDRIVKWNSDILAIANGKGTVSFIFAIIIALPMLSIIIGKYFADFRIAIIFFVDAVILIIPFWFNGNRHVSKQENLNCKIDIVKQMDIHFQKIKKEGENFKPALMLARGEDDKTVPVDTRFTISFDDMPSDFYGIQAQININMVQGVRYPYFYCVIPTKVGYGLKDHLKKVPKSRKITVEFQADEQAEVIVIRQYTTKSSGYHTKINDCKNILNTSLKAARAILK